MALQLQMEEIMRKAITSPLPTTKTTPTTTTTTTTATPATEETTPVSSIENNNFFFFNIKQSHSFLQWYIPKDQDQDIDTLLDANESIEFQILGHTPQLSSSLKVVQQRGLTGLPMGNGLQYTSIFNYSNFT